MSFDLHCVDFDLLFAQGVVPVILGETPVPFSPFEGLYPWVGLPVIGLDSFHRRIDHRARFVCALITRLHYSKVTFLWFLDLPLQI